jgi:hypothetical protein
MGLDEYKNRKSSIKVKEKISYDINKNNKIFKTRFVCITGSS